jgi:hypothetical protein
MCSSPRKPQRNPKPRAAEVSGSNCTSDASLSWSFSSASRRSLVLLSLVGRIDMPAKTIGFTSVIAGERFRSRGSRASKITVSPIAGLADALDVRRDHEADFARAQLSVTAIGAGSGA